MKLEASMSENKKRVPWYLYPFWLVWVLVSRILALTGRLVGAILGLVLMIVGLVVSLTVIGALIGVPLIIFGFTLMIRSFF
jgi:uncharacterized membrane protein HdeD (DUF308 family)